MKEQAMCQIIKMLVITIIILFFVMIFGWVGTNDFRMELHEAGYNKQEIENIINN